MATSKLPGKIAILSYVTQRHQCVTCMQRLKKRTDIVFGEETKAPQMLDQLQPRN